jgi:hypothetical protein
VHVSRKRLEEAARALPDVVGFEPKGSGS